MQRLAKSGPCNSGSAANPVLCLRVLAHLLLHRCRIELAVSDGGIAGRLFPGRFFFRRGALGDGHLVRRPMGRAIAITREHHTHPDHVYGFLENASLVRRRVHLRLCRDRHSLCPVSIVTWTLMLLWLICWVCLLLGMHFHNLAHRPAARRSCDWRSGCIWFARRPSLGPSSQSHHPLLRGERMGQAVCDGLGVWRALERVIGASITGIVPRADDGAWQRNYRETGVLSVPRRRAR